MKRFWIATIVLFAALTSGCAHCGQRPHLFGWFRHDDNCGGYNGGGPMGGGCGGGGPSSWGPWGGGSGGPCGGYGGYAPPCDGPMMMGTPVPTTTTPGVRVIPGESIPANR